MKKALLWAVEVKDSSDGEWMFRCFASTRFEARRFRAHERSWWESIRIVKYTREDA